MSPLKGDFMGWKKFIVAMAACTALSAMAGVKDDFVDTAVKSCGKSKDDAEKLATPGRSGNVVKWQMCKAGTIDIDGCSMNCSDASSKIGN
jgi:hypothetical protein